MNENRKKKKKGLFKKKLARRLLPFFAPFMISPFAAPLNKRAAHAQGRPFQNTVKTLKVADFEVISSQLYEEMHLADSGLNFNVFDQALVGYYNLKHNNAISEEPVLTVIDFSKPSTEKRLWVINLHEKKVIFNTYVAHGRNSGDDIATEFSNEENSYKSSLGFYVTEDLYYGKHGLSLKLIGMDEDFNSNAKDRCIVMHGADYASEQFIKQTGRLGRSLGCPAIPMEEHEDIIQAVKHGTPMYIHFKDESYTSDYLNHSVAMSEFIADGQQI